MRRSNPSLVLAPLAYLKLQYLCHVGPTEVGAFAITAEQEPLYVTDVVTVLQSTTVTTVQFDDTAVAEYFDRCVDAGLHPSRFARIWFHSHPGASAQPSGTDEETFRRVFGRTDWAVMAILSRTGRTYARLRINTGPGMSCRLRWRVDWASWPADLPREALPSEDWAQEYQQNVQVVTHLQKELADWVEYAWNFSGEHHERHSVLEGYPAAWPDPSGEA